MHHWLVLSQFPYLLVREFQEPHVHCWEGLRPIEPYPSQRESQLLNHLRITKVKLDILPLEEKKEGAVPKAKYPNSWPRWTDSPSSTVVLMLPTIIAPTQTAITLPNWGLSMGTILRTFSPYTSNEVRIACGWYIPYLSQIGFKKFGNTTYVYSVIFSRYIRHRAYLSIYWRMETMVVLRS